MKEPWVRLSEELSKSGCEALVVFAPSATDPDLAPFVGSVHLHQALLIARAGEVPALGFVTPMEREEAASTGLRLLPPDALGVAKWAEQGMDEESLLAEVVAQGLALAGVPPGKLLLGGHPSAGVSLALARRVEKAGWQLHSGRDLLRRFRKTKSARDLAAIERAAEGLTQCFERVAELLAGAESRQGELWFEGERLRVSRLRREISVNLALNGLEQPAGNIVAPGRQGGVPHTGGDDETILRPGESLVVDLYPRGDLFVDCTRTFCVGEPPENLQRAHTSVLSGLELAHRHCRPGARAWDLQVAVCELLHEAGYPTPLHEPGCDRGYVHGLGHGVGFELHELPTFREVEDPSGEIAPGDVLTLEPGLYEPNPEIGVGFGVRLEDTVSVEAGGVRNLTPLPYSMDPRAW